MSTLTMLSGLGAGSNVQAVEYVGGVRGGQTNGSAITLDMSSIDVQAGDLIIGVHAVGEDENRLTSMTLTSTGYTELVSLYGNDTYDVNLEVYAKIADGTETSFITANTGLSTSSVEAAVRVYRGPSVIPTDFTSGLHQYNAEGSRDDIPWPIVTEISKGQLLVYIGTTGHVYATSGNYDEPISDMTDFSQGVSNDSEDVCLGVGHKAVLEGETSFTAEDWIMPGGSPTLSSIAWVILRLSTN